jgi:hypothetical protein
MSTVIVLKCWLDTSYPLRQVACGDNTISDVSDKWAVEVLDIDMIVLSKIP